MQTFLPFPDFEYTARILDYRRLGKQRLEALQIIETLLDRPTRSGKSRRGWLRHPAVLMWRGHVDSLRRYYNTVIQEWLRRGYRNTMALEPLPAEIFDPPWLGDDLFHRSHRSQLLRKDPQYYGQFGWLEKPGQFPYVWPSLKEVL